MLRRQLFTALKITIALLVLLSGLYPVAVWAVGKIAFSDRANGSFVTSNGKVVGSSLIGQGFSDKDGNPIPKYFQPRPSEHGYDATNSGGSNLGPSNPKLIDAVRQRVAAYRQFNGLAADATVPVDAVTESGSGLDPDISVANALDQAPRVAKQRGLSLGSVTELVHSHTNGPAWGVLGERTVNVLDLNLALDKLNPPG